MDLSDDRSSSSTSVCSFLPSIDHVTTSMRSCNINEICEEVLELFLDRSFRFPQLSFDLCVSADTLSFYTVKFFISAGFPFCVCSFLSA